MPEATNGAVKNLAAGTKVRVITPGEPPEWSEWEDDHGRLGPPVKKRMQQMFFRGDRKITAEIVFVGSESERDELRRKGRVKVRLKEASGAVLVITADATNIQKA
jgi:hypothetical protein